VPRELRQPSGPATGPWSPKRADCASSLSAARYGCDIAQDVRPWNVRFASENREPAFAPCAFLAGQDARAILGRTQEEFSAALKGSPMKRAKLRGLKRNAAVVLGNVGTSEDADVLTRALDDDEPLVREHAAWALARLRASGASIR